MNKLRLDPSLKTFGIYSSRALTKTRKLRLHPRDQALNGFVCVSVCKSSPMRQNSYSSSAYQTLSFKKVVEMNRTPVPPKPTFKKAHSTPPKRVSKSPSPAPAVNTAGPLSPKVCTADLRVGVSRHMNTADAAFLHSNCLTPPRFHLRSQVRVTPVLRQQLSSQSL